MKTQNEMKFKGWIAFTSAKAANEARRLLRSVHADLCTDVRRSELEPKKVKLFAEDGKAIKRIASFFPKAESCGWVTTAEEKKEARTVDIQAGVDFDHHGKLTLANRTWFFVTAQLGETFDYSNSFNWSEVEERAKEQGWVIEYRGGLTAQIVNRL